MRRAAGAATRQMGPEPMKPIRLLTISAATLILISQAPSIAQDVLSGLQQSEWEGTFDAQSSLSRPVATTAPILSAQTLPAMEQAIYAYQDLVSRGGWNAVPADKTLKI